MRRRKPPADDAQTRRLMDAAAQCRMRARIIRLQGAAGNPEAWEERAAYYEAQARGEDPRHPLRAVDPG